MRQEEFESLGANRRFVMTNLSQTDQCLYDKMYCARDGMENRIKDEQLDLFAGRGSRHRWWPNQFRQLLSGLAYTLFEGLRRQALNDTSLAKASPNRIRLMLLKMGAVVVHNARRIGIRLSSACPSTEALMQLGRLAVNGQLGRLAVNGEADLRISVQQGQHLVSFRWRQAED